jgi:adenylosuccinate lyase
MIPRYTHPEIGKINSDLAKLLRWQESEFAVIRGRVFLGLTPSETYDRITTTLEANLPDVAWWKAQDDEINHDLNAFLDERRRFIPVELQAEWHKDTTSYDTEEPAQALAFLAMGEFVEAALDRFESVVVQQVERHRYTIMLDRTHGQGAKLRSFGGRLLTWYADLRIPRVQFKTALALCRQSRISGAIGNYGGGLTPALEAAALESLDLTPYHGATQIMPRVVYAPLAQSLQLVCEQLGKMALDFRLGARSGYPLAHEPFGKKQKGSSAMPHKKNTTLTEQMAGMVGMARHFAAMLVESIETWESRDIGQSCVERVAWPDLFHVTLRMLSVMTRVVEGMVVYTDNMLKEIVASRGTYASDEAKNFLAEELGKRGVEAEVAYRIVQLASFDVFQPRGMWAQLRASLPASLKEADYLLDLAKGAPAEEFVSIQTFIPDAKLFPVAELQASVEDVDRYNALLRDLFSNEKVLERWHECFKPSNLLRYEEFLYQKLLGK